MDSRLHIRNKDKGTASLPLESFYGKCRVFDLTFVEKEIHRKDLESFQIEKGVIVLLKTRNSTLGYTKFNKDFIHLKLDAAEYLVMLGIKTLGFDYLSIKKFGGDDEVHEMLIDNITLFEGLNLTDVPEGEYTFLGLPIKVDLDGAPARAILVRD